MASDEIVWQVINQQFCSYKLKTTKDQTFCRNEHNVTGLCNRQSCPLANSRYATIRSAPGTGTLYLCIKTPERSHMPNKWWERIRLSANYARALEQIDERLAYWPKFLGHKCKQRLTRLTQVAIRTKRLVKEEERLGERTVSKIAPKVRKREEARERKAEAAAKVERQIERELIERLRSGAYGDRPLNVEEGVWKKVLRGLEREGAKGDVDRDTGVEEEEEEEEEEGEEMEGEREMEEEREGEVEFVSDVEGSEEAFGDLEDWLEGDSPDEGDEDGDAGSDEEGSSASGASDGEDEADNEKLKRALAGAKRKRNEKPPPKPAKRPAKGPRREIEYEIENEPPAREVLYA